MLTPIGFVLGICILFVAAVAGGAAEHEDETGNSTALTAQGVPAKVDGVDAVMLAAYGSAAERITTLRPKCSGMRWSVIAGIGKVESNHAGGRTIAASGDITPRILGPRLDGSGVGGNTDNGRWDGDTAYDRAVGPIQFIPSTWEGPSGADGNGDGTKDPNNAFDAALGTALYLCGTGKSDLSDDAQLRKAILRYNHASSYADKVLGFIHQYDQLAPAVTTGDTSVGGKAGAVIAAALAQQGTPYVWGGGDIHGPTNGGYDCSGLMVYAFYKGAHVTLPRTSQAMRSVGIKVARADMQPGDLIVFNNDGAWGHVGLYIGDGKMVNAPRTGKTV
ncbi:MULTISPECIES: bifunctional lytic transglycosylase/C40 family peptidase [unclassified Streptomyces]|uniref:C40 family peptidase n=1 Tax=unclassified Streptomyces TaxID=2593676 RepID=UPI002E80B3FB|nr:bifunctional lytic transglycosylase/C40 family peptidase [Streptomyces sp. NBC_00589]WTI33616.1 bifunctional lytic transglycosylase/C40 family peptidase [Streptomyces sp. NBC_00775]WUB32712.1 bifunctional lytic transglycosylase/C40 family peptidase [Streptomyces sp. NBC_00589]